MSKGARVLSRTKTSIPAKITIPSNKALFRAELFCRIGKDLLSGVMSTPTGIPRDDWIMYHLLNAIEDLAKGLQK